MVLLVLDYACTFFASRCTYYGHAFSMEMVKKYRLKAILNLATVVSYQFLTIHGKKKTRSTSKIKKVNIYCQVNHTSPLR
jgi:hypothetical protein